jgi:hypothetical protein
MYNDKFERRKKENQEVRSFIKKTLEETAPFLKKHFSTLEIDNYKYTNTEAIEELGLDDDLINQLVEDYVTQIIKTKPLFIEHLETLKKKKETAQTLDYTPLRELAHKNLGVARNLRIIDGTKILYELMKKDDLDYLELCIKALKCTAVRLSPKCAYNTLIISKIKQSF